MEPKFKIGNQMICKKLEWGFGWNNKNQDAKLIICGVAKPSFILAQQFSDQEQAAN